MKRWECVAKRFDKRKKIIGVEVGVYKGKMSKQLLLLMPKLKLHMVDRWCEYTELEKKQDYLTGITKVKNKIWKKIEKKARKKVEEFGERAVIVKMESKNAAKIFKNRSLDFVFLDGNHGYMAVQDDIKNWMCKIKSGGYLCGHDYQRRTVRKAVRRMLQEYELDNDKTWFVRIP